jgi:hypothetical protein
MIDREDTPWYPTARLFRQTRCDDWDEVFERVAVELACLVADKTGLAISRSGMPKPKSTA